MSAASVPGFPDLPGISRPSAAVRFAYSNMRLGYLQQFGYNTRCMKILINSDMLIGVGLGTKDNAELDTSFAELVKTAREKDVELVVPKTAALEHEHHISEIIEGRRSKLLNCANTLRQHGIDVPSFDATKILKPVNVPDLLGGYGIKIENPCLTDYEDAQERACLHKPPAPRGDKDEMRDLVIWAMALRIAKSQKNGAILISNDSVHKDSRVDAEALSVRLERFSDFGDALSHLGKLTPEINTLHEVFRGSWSELIKRGLPLSDSRILTVKPIVFAMSKNLASIQVRADVKFLGADGNSIKASALLTFTSKDAVSISLSNILVNDQPFEQMQIEISATGAFSLGLPGLEDYEGRQKALRKLIGGNQ